MPYLILGISHFVTPYVLGYLGFNLMDYHQYIFYTICVITPGLLGIVIGFRMLDDKDEGISELMSITPAGQRGYLYNRLGFISALSIIYTFYIYLLWPYKIISIPQLVLVSLPLAGYGLILGSVLFIIAPDKVKGLTYAKVLNLLLIFGFSELIPVQGIKFVGYGMPTYWLFKILTDPTPYNLVIAYT
ncbi:MAG: hypothetical protein JXO44_09480, partial [Clostridia bacterium]|nr:hypothetical protein [Clostridia bacterium]